MLEFDLIWLSSIGRLLGAIFVPIASIILAQKMVKDRRARGKWNFIRIGIFLSFVLISCVNIGWWVTLYSPIGSPELYNAFEATFGLHEHLNGMNVTFGLMIIVYFFKLETLYLTPLYFYFGMIIFFLFTGFQQLLEGYVKIGGILTIFFLYFTAIKIRDNGALGLSIFSTIAMSVLFIPNPIVSTLVTIIYIVFMMYFALGYFTPFKEQTRGE